MPMNPQNDSGPDNSHYTYPAVGLLYTQSIGFDIIINIYYLDFKLIILKLYICIFFNKNKYYTL